MQRPTAKLEDAEKVYEEAKEVTRLFNFRYNFVSPFHLITLSI